MASDWIRIESSLYQLNPKTRLGRVSGKEARNGALLKVLFSDQKTGYADFHPWWELGDFPLLEQLEMLRKGQTSSLLEQSLKLARVDAEARFQGKSLWDGSLIPRSHLLCPDLLALDSSLNCEGFCEGFKKLKIKMGAQFEAELKRLNELAPLFRDHGVQVRLDLNGALSDLQVDGFFKCLEPVLDCVDWVEDPTPYQGQLWKRIQKTWGVRLALDRIEEGKILERESFSVLVLKPAIQEWNLARNTALQLDAALAVTSYLDHPVGQVGAAWVASEFSRYQDQGKWKGLRIEDCGLISHLAYDPNPFSQKLGVQKGILIPPSGGTGWGWDQEFENLSWKKVAELEWRQE